MTYSLEEAGYLLGVHPDTVYKYFRHVRIKPEQILLEFESKKEIQMYHNWIRELRERNLTPNSLVNKVQITMITGYSADYFRFLAEKTGLRPATTFQRRRYYRVSDVTKSLESLPKVSRYLSFKETMK